MRLALPYVVNEQACLCLGAGIYGVLGRRKAKTIGASIMPKVIIHRCPVNAPNADIAHPTIATVTDTLTSAGDNGAIAARPLRSRSRLGRNAASINASELKMTTDHVEGVRPDCPGLMSKRTTSGMEMRKTMASRM